ncbi:hypothetical protein RintRC_1736 [Richelia intracellularis]|nr:hypothetical protein RintRC_1736 [Richelia intracellularis]
MVVVDNGSSVRTPQVVESRLGNSPLKSIYEPSIGLSIARNTRARVAKGNVLAYLDDDAVASDQWLQLLYAAYQEQPK